MTGKLWAVIRREYLERVRSKAFIIGTIVGPVLMGGIMLLPILIAEKGGGDSLRVAVLDGTGVLQSKVEETIKEVRRDDEPSFDVRPPGEGSFETREKALRKAVLEGELDGFLLLPADAIEASTATYYGRTVSNQRYLNTMRWNIRDLLIAHRLAGAGLDPEQVEELTRDMEWRTIRLSEEGEEEDQGLAIVLAIILLMILYTSILMWGQIVMTSIIEEKGSRVIEVVASGVPPTQLLAGKLLGVGGAGLTQFLVWALSLLGISLVMAGPMAGTLPLPEVSPLVLVSFVLCFLLGFAFYASLYAGIGAAVNTVQEAQNFVFPVIIPLVLGLVCFPVIIESPDGQLATILSMVPFLTPLLMFLRIVILTPPAWQIALSLVLMVGSILGALWLAARIYRVGILMYGKKPTFPELMKWVGRA
jgi:ABC-2 type transport system permease protein